MVPFVNSCLQAGLSILVFLSLVTVIIIKTTPYSSIELVQPLETIKPPSVSRFYERTDQFLLSRSIVINRNLSVVADAVLAPQLWTLCYPETLGVGGVSRRRVRPGDVIFEKFLFAGIFYVVFRYDVETVELKHPGIVRFHGIVVFSNDIIQRYFQWVVDQIGGTFEYKFNLVNSTSTEWQRDLYIYTTSHSWTVRSMFWLAIATIRSTQQKGATQFLACTKLLLESMDGEMWAELR